MAPVFEIRDDAIAQFRRPGHAEGDERHRSYYEDKLRQQIARNLLARNGKSCSGRGMRMHDSEDVWPMPQDAQV